MEFQLGKLITYKGKKYKMSSVDGDIITLKCAVGCPKTVRVHKDQL
jgi:hypothetical protein